MRLSKRQLKQIIREEYTRLIESYYTYDESESGLLPIAEAALTGEFQKLRTAADWGVSAWFVGPGDANFSSGAYYIVHNEDFDRLSYSLVRRWYSIDHFDMRNPEADGYVQWPADAPEDDGNDYIEEIEEWQIYSEDDLSLMINDLRSQKP